MSSKYLSVCFLFLASCTVAQAEQTGRSVGRALEVTASTKEKVQSAYYAACHDVALPTCEILRGMAESAPVEAAVEVQAKCQQIEESCDLSYKGLQLATDLLREADAILKGSDQ